MRTNRTSDAPRTANMRLGLVHRFGSLVLGWLLVASVLVVAPPSVDAADAEALDGVAGFVPTASLALGSGDVQFARSSLSAAALLAGPADGSVCEEPHPDTAVLTSGQIEIVQVGHRDSYAETQIIDLAGLHLSSPAGYRYELAVCMAPGWPPEPLAAQWAGDPYELVLAEDALAWFESARDDAFESTFKDKAPGWRVWPDRAHHQIVGLDSWLYIENYFGLLSGRETSGGDQIEVLVEAEPQRSEWEWSARDTSDGGIFTCSLNNGQGAAFANDATADHCPLTWAHSSSVTGEIELRVRLIYNVQITTTTLNNDDANNRAGQSFVQHIFDHPGQWDVHEDANFPSDYRLYVSEVLTFGYDNETNAETFTPAAARGATPGGKQIGPSSGCWIFGAVCKIAAEVGGVILDFIVPDFIQKAIEGCWDGAVSAVGGIADTIGSLNPLTWDDKYNEFIEFKNMLQEAQANNELQDVLLELGTEAAWGMLHLDKLDPTGSGEFDQLVWDDPLLITEWITTVGCELIVGSFTGGIAAKLGRLLKILRDRKNRPNNDPNNPDPNNPNDPDDKPNNNPPCSVSGDSFPTGTQVRLANGQLQEIQLIQPGDHVLAYDTNTNEWQNQQVLDQWSAIDRGYMTTITLTDGSVSTATDHHPYWVESQNRWIKATNLTLGDQLLAPTGHVEVQSATTAPLDSTIVWELTVDNVHNFTVHVGNTDVLVHNTTACPAQRAKTDEEISTIKDDHKPDTDDPLNQTDLDGLRKVDLPYTKPDGPGWSQAPSPDNPNLRGVYRDGDNWVFEMDVNGETRIVSYNKEGYPDFSPYSEAQVTLPDVDSNGDSILNADGTRNRGKDNTAANGIVEQDWGNSSPPGYSWHHVEGSNPAVMQLVDHDVHAAFSHSGGVASQNNGG